MYTYVTKELFIIPNHGTFLLFAPLKGSLLEVNASVIALLQKCEKSGNFPKGDTMIKLKHAGILIETLETEHACCSKKKKFEPCDVTLFPTSDCNLCCTYCYASAGETHYSLPWHIAKKAIDFVFANGVKNHAKKVSIGFHGGGEPFYGEAWPIVKLATAYAKKLSEKNNIFVSLSSATNGVLSIKQLEWLINNFGNLNVSFDGPEDIQNRQRPLKSGNGSFPYVLRTIQFLEKHKFSYGIRSTITKESCGRLFELIDFFRSISNLTRYHFEPLFECGRCKTTGAQAPDPMEFARSMMEAIPYAKKHGIELHYSGADIDRTVESFCGASGRSFCVTPQGNVTSCFEVSLDTDSRARKFFYGKYVPETDEFLFNSTQIEFLRKRTIRNLPHCNDCFIKYQCAGDCLAKVDTEGDMFNTGKNTRCVANHLLSKFKMIEKLAQAN